MRFFIQEQLAKLRGRPDERDLRKALEVYADRVEAFERDAGYKDLERLMANLEEPGMSGIWVEN